MIGTELSGNEKEVKRVTKHARQVKHLRGKYVRFPLDLKPGTLDQFRVVCEDNGTTPTTEIKKLIKKFTEEHKMKQLFIDFNTGAGNGWADTLEEAMELAEEGLAYTQQPVTVYDGEREVARLPWYGVEPEEGEVVTAHFGNYGFYGEWIIYD